ncbi:hypothetical protein KKH43_06150 [Patescibacteria group bacterium]|nr:hypothetical protein [Patescibacteria group bacterium]
MKVLYLDIDEEITAVIDKIRKTKEHAIVLVIPKRSMLTQSTVTLKLLKRQVDAVGKRIVVVVSDDVAFNLSKRAGLDVRKEVPSSMESTLLDQEEKPVGQEPENQQDEKKEVLPTAKTIPIVAATVPGEKHLLKVTDYLSGKSKEIEPRLSVPKEKDVPKEESISEKEKSKETVRTILETAKKESEEKKPKRKAVRGSVLDSEAAQTRGEEPSSRGLSSGPMSDSRREKKNKKQRKARSKNVFLPRISVTFFVVFFLISFGLAGLIFFILLPKAVISIQPETEQFISQVDVLVREAADEVDQANNQLPGELLYVEKTSDKKHFEAYGEQDISTKARGEVVINNTFSSSPQPLVAQTRFQAPNGSIYRVLNDVNVPGATVQDGETIPGRLQVVLEADQPGTEYNIESAKLIIPGLTGAKQAAIYAETLSPIAGGEKQVKRIISEEDMQNASNELLTQVEKKAIDELVSRIPKDQYFFKDAIKTEIIERVASNEVGEEVTEYDLQITVRVSTMTFNQQDMEEIVAYEVEKALTDGKKVLQAGIDEGVTASLQNFDFNDKSMGIVLKIEKTFYYTFDETYVREELKGKSKEEIKTFLAENPHILSSEVTFWPFWVKKAPKLDKKIELELDIAQ